MGRPTVGLLAQALRGNGLLHQPLTHGLLGGALAGRYQTPQPYVAPRPMAKPRKHKIFISYHHAGDRLYYDQFRSRFQYEYDLVSDNSVDREIDSNEHSYVIQRIRENHIRGSSCTFVLVGAKTWGRKYVDWEISATLDRKHGLVAIKLPTAPIDDNGDVMWPGRLWDNIWSRYTAVVEWSELMQHPERVSLLIQDANDREKRLINNMRTRRTRNEGGD